MATPFFRTPLCVRGKVILAQLLRTERDNAQSEVLSRLVATPDCVGSNSGAAGVSRKGSCCLELSMYLRGFVPQANAAPICDDNKVTSNIPAIISPRKISLSTFPLPTFFPKKFDQAGFPISDCGQFVGNPRMWPFAQPRNFLQYISLFAGRVVRASFVF